MVDASIRPEVLERIMDRRGRPYIYDTIAPARTALIVVDMQNYFMEEGAPVEVPEARGIVSEINRLADAVRRTGGTVVWIQMTQDERDLTDWSVFFDRMKSPEMAKAALDGLKPGSHGHDLWPEMDARETDLRVAKRRFSAFLPESSDLAEILRGRGIDTVIVTGTLTNVCCLTSALDAMMMNFKLIMVSDANATRLDTQHAGTLNVVFETFGDVRSTDETVALLEAGATKARAAE